MTSTTRRRLATSLAVAAAVVGGLCLAGGPAGAVASLRGAAGPSCEASAWPATLVGAEPVPVVIVSSRTEEAIAAARAFAEADDDLAATDLLDRPFQLAGPTLGERPEPGFELLRDLDELAGDDRVRVVATFGPIAARVRDALGADPRAYVVAAPLSAEPDELSDELAGEYRTLLGERRDAGRLPAPEALTLAPPESGVDGRSFEVDARDRGARDRVPVESIALRVDGRRVTCDGARTLPATVEVTGLGGGDALDRVAVEVDGDTLTARMTDAVFAIPSEGQTDGASSGADDGSSTSNLVAGLVAGLVIGGIIAVVVQARGREGGGGRERGTAGPPPGWPGAGAVAAPEPPKPGSRRRTRAAPIPPLDLTRPAPGWTAAVPGVAQARLNDLGLMRVLPQDGEAGRVWVTEAMGLLCAAGWLEKKPGLGEDAEPTLRLHESGRGLLGVYDGVGGSGSAAARRLRDGTELSGAYVAARLTRDLVEAWYTRSIDGHAELDDETGEALATWLRAALRDEAEFLPAARGGLRGSLHRVLPTTAAVLAFGPGGTDHEPTARADVWWAGDSRAFVLTPLGGLQVLSIDDTREHDALALIRNDQPMDNLVSADRPFALHRSSVEVSGPAVFLVATDGCYGYLRTPAHFEYLLLRMLEAATSLEEWAVGIVDTLAGFTGDDASFSLAAVGFSGLESMQGAFAERYDYLYGQHWMPFREADGDPERIEALREESWLVYRDLYHARLARDGGLDPSGPGSGAGPSDAMAPGPDPFGDQQS